MTTGQYIKQIEDALLAQQKRISSSRKEATKLIDALGMRHLLAPAKAKKKGNYPKKAVK